VSFLSGRWPRKTFNLVLLSSGIVAYLLIEVSPFFNIVIERLGIEALKPVIILLTVLLNIGFVLIMILRLHDLNRAGWWSLLVFIPFVNVLFVILLMLWPGISIEHRYKKVMKTLAKVFSLVILAVLLLQIDDDLNVEVTEYVLLIEDRVANGSEAYLYLTGITAVEEKNILSQGSRLLRSYNNSSKNIFSSLRDAEKLNIDEKTNNVKKLITPDNKNKMYCQLSDSGCLSSINDSSSNWKNEIKKFSVITKRYEKFISYPEFTTLTRADYSSPYPASHYLTFGNKLKIFSALSLARSGKAEEAIEMLLIDNRYLRRHLSLADSLIHKLIFINLYSNNLDIIVYVHSAYKLEKPAKIAHLSHSEMSMKYPLIREFIMQYNAYLDADRNPDGWNGLPGWMVRVIFKPNMTINKRLISYKDIISLSNLSAKEFAESVVNIESAPKSKPNYRNYGGSIMIEEPITYFSQYIAKSHDLNAKISLANFVLSNKTQSLENPYGALYNKTTERDNFICLDGPLKDKYNIRCIREKI
jgi:uncharacterized membrane protein YhaH (DUF805 family)